MISNMCANMVSKAHRQLWKLQPVTCKCKGLLCPYIQVRENRNELICSVGTITSINMVPTCMQISSVLIKSNLKHFIIFLRFSQKHSLTRASCSFLTYIHFYLDVVHGLFCHSCCSIDIGTLMYYSFRATDRHTNQCEIV